MWLMQHRSSSNLRRCNNSWSQERESALSTEVCEAGVVNWKCGSGLLLHALCSKVWIHVCVFEKTTLLMSSIVR
jgi:hypothetical protein